MQNQILFLGFLVSDQGISADSGKVKAIREWLESKILTEAHSFYYLVSFDRRVLKGFSIITAQITKCLKLETFKRASAAHNTYLDIK